VGLPFDPLRVSGALSNARLHTKSHATLGAMDREERPYRLLYLLGEKLRKDIADLGQEMKTEIAGLRQEVKTDIADLRQEVKAEIAGLRQEMKTEINTASNRLMLFFAAVAALIAFLTWLFTLSRA